MKLVVDTNIVFSAMLNTDSRIARILLFSGNHYEFYSPYFLKSELVEHKSKILRLTKYSESEFWDIHYLITKNISFIDENLIKEKFLLQATEVLQKIDADDIPFLALALQLKAPLWTGDKKVIKALLKTPKNLIISTNDLLDKL